MKTRKKLFLCNTVYQIIIASWMKYKLYPENKADIIVSNHINGYKKIADNLKNTKLFDNVYTVDSLDCSRYKVHYKNKYYDLLHDCLKNRELKQYFDINSVYDELYVSNLDGFTKLIFSVLNKKFGTKICMFEDGTSTYSKLYERFYENSKPAKTKYNFIVYNVFKNKSVYGNVVSLWVLNKDALLWKPKYEVKQIPSIEVDEKYKGIINTIFDYENSTDRYDEKYIYFEESFYADTGYMEDVELVNRLSDLIGKENILIKIHPRNPVNRFKDLGYKTNKDISIPWEVILMNNDFSDKVLITIGSQTIVTPCILFNMHIKSYSLYNCIKNKPQVLEGPLFDVLMMLYKKYSDNITLCESIDEIANQEEQL